LGALARKSAREKGWRRYLHRRDSKKMRNLNRPQMKVNIFLWTTLVFLTLFHLIATAQAEVSKTQAKTENDLNPLVQQYLLSEDEKQAEALLKEILAHKEASIGKLEALIREGQLYPPDPPVGAQNLSITVRKIPMDYALYVPENYDLDRAYPLIVCLHGAGFVGDSYLDRWKTRLGEKNLLLCPTMSAGAWWSSQGEALVMAAVEEVASKYRIDRDRIFLTGMSNGGIGVYLVGIFHSDRFSAISPMASGIPKEIFPYLKNFSLSGIYIIHGAKDQVMPVRLSRDVSAYLKSEKIVHIYREHDIEHPIAGGHFFPREELPALVDWFQNQRRIADPVKIVSVRDRIHLNPYYWTEIEETEGAIANIQKSILSNQEVELVRSGSFPSLVAEIDGNHVRVTTRRVKKATFYFNNRLIDFLKPVIVTANGQKVFEGKLNESPEFLLKEAKRRGDRVSFYSAAVTVDINESHSKK
ncbi:prolyl oligopeptidase family serine peptidase, partial [Nitrospira defluvii]|nr:prolyl oligopeptidase family serine peptidase [Nitrospira defluvii]